MMDVDNNIGVDYHMHAKYPVLPAFAISQTAEHKKFKKLTYSEKCSSIKIQYKKVGQGFMIL